MSVQLSKREREIMDILYRLETASAEEIRREMDDELSNATVRTLLRILAEKKQVGFRQEGAKYLYFPAISSREASQSALMRMVDTFFSGSPTRAVAAMLSMTKNEISIQELDELSALIEKAKRES
jgi:predicted transcriptional regulator